MDKYHHELTEHLREAVEKNEPKRLYDPIKYILSIGGKRIRPALTLMVCDFFGTDFKKAIPAALAVELFHNFSLIHDDIMDEAPLRRGKKTVHEKWDLNTAILSGDALLILAYRYFEKYDAEIFRELAVLFSQTAIQVCEGQQLDMDFETREKVEISEYIKMIEQKTAVLLGAAMQMGAIVAHVPEDDKETMYQFGKNLGIAFQLQDDYLDVFGNPETFGKQVGGDIIANKKTFLYLMAREKGTEAQAKELADLFNTTPSDPADKIVRVREIFLASKAADASQVEIEKYSNKAYSLLSVVNIPEDKKKLLRQFGEKLMQRRV